MISQTFLQGKNLTRYFQPFSFLAYFKGRVAAGILISLCRKEKNLLILQRMPKPGKTSSSKNLLIFRD